MEGEKSRFFRGCKKRCDLQVLGPSVSVSVARKLRCPWGDPFYIITGGGSVETLEFNCSRALLHHHQMK
ncbi:hypothetical protein R1flu_004836 [Riccia fluitans]|uniref:Uncharacterized protein n=1 Tax=Riccia fluitans TaxID=41844 RepID=A0ABD1YUG7_9MARC